MSLVLLIILQSARMAAARVAEEPSQVAEARAALDAHDLDRARKLASTATSVAPRDARAWMVLGLSLFRSGHPADAVPAFRRLTDLEPNNGLAWFNLGSALYQSGGFAGAIPAYERAASLDAKVAPLAHYDAAIAAGDAGQLDRAERALDEAAAEARAQRQNQLLEKIEAARSDLSHALERSLMKKAKGALLSGHAGAAATDYRNALEHAKKRGAPEEERAELAYGLGHALLADGDAAASAAAFREAALLRPREADFQLMLGIACFRALEDDAARDALRQAIALGLGAADRQTADKYLLAIAHDRTHDRLLVDVRAGAGWDSDVPQAAAVQTAGSAAIPQSAAGFLSVDLDVMGRLAGRHDNGLQLAYRFNQLAYLSTALDTYSLEEHDLDLIGTWTPHHRVSFELDVQGFALFSGVETFAPFQAGMLPALRMNVREGHDLQTLLRYAHDWKDSLATTYDYLGGHRDELSLGEEWAPRHLYLRLYAGYQFASDRVGTAHVSLHDIAFPLESAFPARTLLRYAIPFSYQGHEARICAQYEPHPNISVTLDLRYEKQLYTQQSFIRDSATGAITYRRTRADDRYSVNAFVRLYMPLGFDLSAIYSLTGNASNIDFRNPATALDYDDRNYVKHVITFEVAWRY